jgi:hypothetical protein
MYRRAADVRARADSAAAAREWLTSEPSAVRVCGGGGGRRRGACPHRPGSRVGDVNGAERCLAQRRELECRSHSTAHQLAERALGRATCRQLGEHVFVKLGMGSDGTSAPSGGEARGFGSTKRKNHSEIATGLAGRPDRAPLRRCPQAGTGQGGGDTSARSGTAATNRHRNRDGDRGSTTRRGGRCRLQRRTGRSRPTYHRPRPGVASAS